MNYISHITRTLRGLPTDSAPHRAPNHGRVRRATAPDRDARGRRQAGARRGLLLSLLGPVGLAPLWSQQAYVGDFGSKTVSVIDTRTNTVVATVGVGTFPYSAAIPPMGPVPM